MDFSNYGNMIIKKINKKLNTWWPNTIKKLSLNFDSTDNLVLLDSTNSKIVENAIKTNPNYNGDFYKKIYLYHLYRLNNNLTTNNNTLLMYDRESIFDIVRMIDLENNTNQWRYKDNQKYLNRMVDYIINPKKKFWEKLKNGSIRLVEDLRRYATKSAKVNGPKSLASKICKYFDELFYDKNDYYISDNVVRRVLPYYLNYYKITVKAKTKGYFDNLSYNKLHLYLEKIKNKLNKISSTLSRSNIDHIMWYCYRFEG